MVDALCGQCLAQEAACLRLELHGGAFAPVAPVVPLQADDAAAGTQVHGLLAALWLREPGQQQRVRPEAVGRRTKDFCFIIQNLGGMFHICAVNPLPKYRAGISGKIVQGGKPPANKKQQTRFEQVCCF